MVKEKINKICYEARNIIINHNKHNSANKIIKSAVEIEKLADQILKMEDQEILSNILLSYEKNKAHKLFKDLVEPLQKLEERVLVDAVNSL